MSDREKVVLRRAFFAYESAHYHQNRQSAVHAHENEILKSRMNMTFKSGMIAERRRIEQEQRDEKRDRDRASHILLRAIDYRGKWRRPRRDNPLDDPANRLDDPANRLDDPAANRLDDPAYPLEDPDNLFDADTEEEEGINRA